MYVSKVTINNFRLLSDVEIIFEPDSTVIVGRNNSGKTSLTELFRRLLSSEKPTFRLEDFSQRSHEAFWRAFLANREGQPNDVVRTIMPVIEVKITVNYSEDLASVGPLCDFIVDLNTQCVEAVIRFRYEPRDGSLENFFSGIDINQGDSEIKQKAQCCKAIRERIGTLYVSQLAAIDPSDNTNIRRLELAAMRNLLNGGFINAQRGLDDTTHKDKDVLGRVVENLFNTALSENASEQDRDVAKKLEAAVTGMQAGIDEGFNKQLQDLLPAFSLFGYRGLADPCILTETTLEVKRLLTDHTRVRYAGANGINFPETYNGLGARNLIYILLKLLEFFKGYMALPAAPGVHLIFIEEPEVHLHPQMQEVFIGNLQSIAAKFAEVFNAGRRWPVQFVVTTHSSHMANKARFECIRYFLTQPNEEVGGGRLTKIKDLRKGLGASPVPDRDFLHKYMTLTRCDLFFADKVILIEGPTERLMLPEMIEKIDAEHGARLGSQYISTVEVSGAYAHRFFDLVNFLELRTLIITDLDSVKTREEDGRRVACRVSEGTHTSNACLKAWFNDNAISPATLISKTDGDKISQIRRIAFEVPEQENDPCGRSFEDAFILANGPMFQIVGGSNAEKEAKAWDLAKSLEKKSDFAVEYAINSTNWRVPRYISEGLKWLAEGENVAPLVVPEAINHAAPPAELPMAGGS